MAKRKTSPVDNRKRADAVAAVADKFSMWRPAASVLTAVKGVQTVFIGVDAKTGIGAWPLGRVTVVHGPSNEGKTAFVLGLGLSFLLAGGWFFHIDAERTTPVTWLNALMGEHVRNERFLALRPDTYEEAAASVRQVATMRIADPELLAQPTVIVVDSIRKLTPKNLLDELMKMKLADNDKPQQRGRFGKKPKGIDGAGGRAAQMKAALNSQWLDELIPLADKANMTIVIIARELGDDDDQWGDNVVVAGGKALNYDASLRVRISIAEAITEGDGADRMLIAERHAVEIRKTKIASKDKRRPRGYFHTSTSGSDQGVSFDLARDALFTGEAVGAVQLKGAFYTYGRHKLGQGKDQALRRLREDPELLSQLQTDIRMLFVLDGETGEQRAARAAAAAIDSEPSDVPRNPGSGGKRKRGASKPESIA